MYWIMRPLNPHLMIIFAVMHESWIIKFLVSWQKSNWCDSNWRDLSQRWRDSNRREYEPKSFCAQFYNFKIIVAPRVFENTVSSRVFTLTYHFTMPQHAPFGEIWHPCDGVEDVEDPLSGNLWYYSSNGSIWIHTDAIITILKYSSSLHSSTTL